MKAFLVLLGFSEGIVVGAGVVALLTLLDIIPRLCQITNSYGYLKVYELMLIAGTFFGSLFSLTNITFNLGNCTLVVMGIFYGIFIGLLASALAEAIDVIPVIERRFKIHGKAKYIILVIIFGKVFGSIINWTILKLR
ncbi:stage V sporulation protein AB [Tepidibacter thalassicus]|uniref:Stage V sporulation protein AB n=1 Tax=Tepidibacter thalassicus DSM 15285 TaxID=1123350 RepID=A0A1M5TU27_9FIRM|nr:stage V sporulation protein AB [Tepidibacter thalassicus]SHH54234.1 stage V sporulation protein AB [Tepidibacter thalassicus DSM 15285]